jgi:hypothetical protein
MSKQEAEPADVVFVSVGQDAAFDTVGVVHEVREVRQHQVDAGHLDVRKHEPAIEDDDPPLYFYARAVPADLSETA